MTEKELMQLILKNEEPDFDRIEQNCLKEFDQKKPSVPRWIYAAAAVLLLAVLSVFIMSHYGNRNLSLSPVEPTDAPSSYDYSQWLFFEGGINAGCGDDSLYHFKYLKNGTIFENYKNIDGTDYEPKLLNCDILEYGRENFLQNADRLKSELLEKLKEFTSLSNFDFTQLKETDAEELTVNTYRFREIYLEGGSAIDAYEYFLEADLDGEVKFSLSPEESHLSFGAGTDIIQGLRELVGTGREDSYTELLPGNRYYDAFLKMFGIVNGTCELLDPYEDEWFSKAFVHESGENEAALFDRYYVQRILVTPRFYVSYPEGEEVAAVSVNCKTRFGGEIVSAPAGVKFVPYADAKEEAIRENADKELAGTSLVYAFSGDKKYYVPCYQFHFVEEKTEEEVVCFTKLIPAYDFSEYFSQMQ